MKKNNLKRNKVAKILAIWGLIVVIVIPISINFLLVMPGRGSDDGWLGFWGGYLGSIIAILYASCAARKEAEKAKLEVEEHIEEARKAEVRAYHDKAKLNKIFEVQEELTGIVFELGELIKKMKKFEDAKEIPSVEIEGTKNTIERLGNEAVSVNQKIIRLQYYFDKETEDYSFYANVVIKNIKEKTDDEFKTISTIFTRGEYTSVMGRIVKYKTERVERQIENINSLLTINRKNI